MRARPSAHGGFGSSTAAELRDRRGRTSFDGGLGQAPSRPGFRAFFFGAPIGWQRGNLRDHIRGSFTHIHTAGQPAEDPSIWPRLVDTDFADLKVFD
jgi:hypothetical protein